MAGELFKSMAGVDIVHIPYKSSGGARTDVLGGQVDMMFDAVGTMTDLIATGKVRCARHHRQQTRSSVMPDVPTMAELGLPDYTATIWLGILAPKGTPQPIVDLLERRGHAASSARPDVRRAWDAQGATPMAMTPAEFGTLHPGRHRQVGDDRRDLRREAGTTGARRGEGAAQPGSGLGDAGCGEGARR